MLVTPPRKNKIALSDYPYRKDIEHRIFMSQLSVMEATILEEIVNHSIKVFFEDLTEALEISEEQLLPFLHELSEVGFLTLKSNHVVVDKDLRRYYESQLIKFDERFHPGIDYLQSLLNKVPIHILPSWYAIPKTSDNIFESIIEKYLITPKVYRSYLQEISFDQPQIKEMIQDLFAAPNYQLPAAAVKEKYQLTAQQFEELMLYLEFSLIGCLSYTRVDHQWQEIITPFYEWQEYLQFEAENQPAPLPANAITHIKSEQEFAFLNDAERLLKDLPLKTSHSTAPLSKQMSSSIFAQFACEQAIKHKKNKKKWLSLSADADIEESQEFLQQVAERFFQLELISIEKGAVYLSKKGRSFFSLPSMQEKAIYWYRHITQEPDARLVDPNLCTDRHLRNIESSLKPFVQSGWVTFDNFLKSMAVPIGTTSGVSLVQKGKKWNYAIPQYNEQQQQFIAFIVLEQFFECGLVNTGEFEGKTCFTITPFGRVSIGD